MSIYLLAVFILVIVFLFLRFRRVPELNDAQLVYFLIFFLIYIFTLCFGYQYFADDSDKFSNTSFTFLRHFGYTWKNKLVLADSDNPEQSLYEEDEGQLSFQIDNKQVFAVAGNYENPFYLSKPNEEYFELFNKGFSFTELDTLVIHDRIRNINYKLVIIDSERGHSTSVYYVLDPISNQYLKSGFSSKIHRGYPLLDIFLETPFADRLPERLIYALEGLYLVREKIPVQWYKNKEFWNIRFLKKEENLSPFNVIITKKFSESGFSIGHSSKSGLSKFIHKIPDNAYFFSGIGYHSHDLMYIQNNPLDNSCSLNYYHPKFNSLPGQKGKFIRLGLCSGMEELKELNHNQISRFGTLTLRDNVNHIKCELRYKSGNSKVPVSFQFTDFNNRQPGYIKLNRNDTFSLESSNPDLSWNFGFFDSRNDRIGWSPFLLLFTLLLILIWLRLFLSERYRLFARMQSLEFTLLALIWVFLVIRYFLIWRTNTFFPIDDINLYEFLYYRDGEKYLYVNTLIPLSFFLLLYVVVIWTRDSDSEINIRIFRFLSRNYLPLIFTFGLLCILSLLRFISNIPDRFLIILPGMLGFFLVEFWFLNIGNRFINISLFRYQFQFNPIRLYYSCLFILFFLFHDAGYGFLFLIFFLVYRFILFLSMVSQNRRSQRIYLIIFGSLLVSLLFHTFIITILFEKIIILYVTVLLLLFIILYNLRLEKHRIRRIYLIGLPTILFILLILFKTPFSKKIERLDYAYFRAKVLNTKIENSLINTSFSSEKIQKLLRAEHNVNFIYDYAHKKRTDRFTFQPYSQQGCPYTMQLSDLALNRFIISEHGKFAGLVLLGFLYLPLLVILSERRDHNRAAGFLIPGVCLFLFITGVFVYYTSTNKIIFFGQDFPFLSVNSLLVTILPLTIILLVLFLYHIPFANLNSEYEAFSSFNQHRNNINNTLFLLPVIFFLYSIIPSGKHGYENLIEALNIPSQQIQTINDEFVRFQKANTQIQNASFQDIFKMYTANPTSQIWNKLRNDSSAIFLNSLLNNLIESKINYWNPNEILHVRYRAGLYHLVLNKKYYSIASSNSQNAIANYNLVSSVNKIPSRIRFNNKEFNFDKYNRSITKFQKVNSQKLPENIDVFFVPQRFLLDSLQNIILISKQSGNLTENSWDFTIQDSVQQVSSEKGMFTLRLLPSDVINFYQKPPSEEGSSSATLTFLPEMKKSFVKSVLVNGKPDFVYPLGEKFNWIFIFNEFYKNHHKNADSAITELSLDYDLLESIYDASKIDLMRQEKSKSQERSHLRDYALGLNNAYHVSARGIQKSTKNSRSSPILIAINDQLKMSGVLQLSNPQRTIEVKSLILKYMQVEPGFSCVVLDDQGKILCMVSNQTSPGFDPNEQESYYKMLETFYRKESIRLEREIFGNKCLLKMNNGPGSSFKPIIFSAIASDVNLGWEKFRIPSQQDVSGAARKINKQTGESMIKFYGGRELDNFWDLDISPREFITSNYLIYSNNLFHSLMVFLGNYSTAELLADFSEKERSILKTYDPEEPPEKRFPNFYFKGKHYCINEAYWPEFGIPNNPITNGLSRNYGFVTSNFEFNSPYDHALGIDSDILDPHTVQNFAFVFPESSSINTIDRKINSQRNSFIQPALGAWPIEITPLKMAESAIRLVKKNRTNDFVSLFNHEKIVPQNDFYFDQSWKDEEYKNFVDNLIINQLYKVAIEGTANELKALSNELRTQKGLFLYVKTGTISEQTDSYLRDKHLLIIISNEDLIHAPPEESSPKFITSFISFYNIIPESRFESIYNKYIRLIVESESFNDYMYEF